jgi:hypothetical protein
LIFYYLCTLDTSINQNKQKPKMKKVFTLIAVASISTFVACGPSAEEKAKLEADAKAKMDSLFNAASTSITTATDSTAVAPATTEAAPAATPEATPAKEEKKH